MAQQTIGVGTSANDNTGDPLRTAFTKTNSNFTELYSGKQDADADLTALAALTGTGLVERTGSATYSTATVTSYIKTLLDDIDAAAARTTLQLVIGTDVQAYNARLTDITSGFSGATNGYYIRKKADGSGLEYAAASVGGSGTVTSVALSLPAIFSVSGSPVTTTGTLTGTLANQNANLVFAGPTTGAATTPAFRSLVAGDIPDLSSTYQPLDSDLTAIAALTTTTFGRSLLTEASASTLRSTLSLVPGTNVQTQNSRLQDISDNLTATSGTVEKTGAATFGTYTVTSFAKTVLDDTTQSAVQTTLGLLPGTDVQAYSARLADIVSGFAGATNGQFIRKNAGGTALEYATVSGSGTVTSVALSLTSLSWLSISGSPITTSGTLALSATTGLTANQVLATPNGSTGAVSLRSLVAADIPSLTAAKISDFDTQVRTSTLNQMAAPTTSLSLNSQRITSLATPTSRTDGSTKGYVDDYLPLEAEGRLTLASGDGNPSADQTAKTTLYWTPWNGNRVYLWNSSDSAWKPYTFSEISLALTGLAANTNHDIFLYDNSGTLTLEAVAWTNNTSRASAVSRRNGATVKTSDDRLLLGTIRTTGSTGTTEDSQNRRLLSNIFNRQPASLKRTDTTASWTYNTSTWRQARASSANQVGWVACEASIALSLTYQVYTTQGTATSAWCAIGVDSTSAPHTDSTVFSSLPNTQTSIFAALNSTNLATGYHYGAMLEYSSGGNTSTFYGVSSTFEICKMVGTITR